MDISQDKYIKEFLKNRNLQETTSKVYLVRLSAYCKFIDQAPTELINETIENDDNGVRMIKCRIRSELLDYKTHLIESGKSNQLSRGT